MGSKIKYTKGITWMLYRLNVNELSAPFRAFVRLFYNCCVVMRYFSLPGYISMNVSAHACCELYFTRRSLPLSVDLAVNYWLLVR